MEEIILRELRFDNHHSGLGVSSPSPRVSWSFSHGCPRVEGWEQEAYDIEVAFAHESDSDVYFVKSSESLYVPWPARKLRSREAARVRVRCYGSDENSRRRGVSPNATAWSPWASVETAILDDADWQAQWIAAPEQIVNDDGSLKPICLTKQFDIPKCRDILRARLYITSRGCYEAKLNGSRIGDESMSPGWQSYKYRLHYQTFDVTRLLSTSSKNELDVTIAAGWYASALAWAGGRRCFFGNELSLLAQLVVDFKDDIQSFVVKSDETWQSTQSPLSSSEIYKGEIYDCSITWESQQSNAQTVRVVKSPSSRLVSPDSPPVRITEIIKPTKIFRSRSGKVLLDFGQNLVGRLCIKSLTKPAGTKVSFAHAEVLEEEELGRRPLRYATSTDMIICDGSDLRMWTPKFTFHGFRYVEVVGWSPEDDEYPLSIDSIEAQVLHTDMQRTGYFECSHPMINKLHENALWSMRGNFLSLPTDCPQRDERLGWTGDIQIFAPSASFLYNTTAMLGNWLDDLAAEQLSTENNGVPPFVVPDVISQANDSDHDFWIKTPNAVWDDAAVLIPWTLYRASGDRIMLSKQMESMTTWLDNGVRRGPDLLWDPELVQLGDWLDPFSQPSEPGNGRTDGTLVADAYLVHITFKMVEICRALSLPDEEQKYAQDHAQLLIAFRDKYIPRSGLMGGNSQTAMALALIFDLLETPEQIRNLSSHLALCVRKQAFRVSTGFVGTPIILHALTKACHPQLAYRMLLEQRCPSWLYAVSMGATTIWERWDSALPDGRINPGEMTSFNHYAFGSVVNWLHEYAGGISALSQGWKEILIRPIPGGSLTSAKVSFDSPYGLIECSWRLDMDGTAFIMDVLVPPNAKAKVVLPHNTNHESMEELMEEQWVGSGHHHFECVLLKKPWPPEAIMTPFYPQPHPLLASSS